MLWQKIQIRVHDKTIAKSGMIISLLLRRPKGHFEERNQKFPTCPADGRRKASLS